MTRAAMGSLTVDAHSHFYFPSWVELLRSRTANPRIVREDGTDRFCIVPEEAAGGERPGRPMDATYWTVESKLAYMDAQGVDVAVVSPGNPWIDFVAPEDAASWARRLNTELDEMCARHAGRLYGLGLLPLQSIPEKSLAELDHLARLRWVRGVTMGTRGAGKGLDDPALEPLWARLEALSFPVFVHPHYGVGSEAFGAHGYVLNFSLGFVFETTVSIARLVLAGVLDRFPGLTLMLAHGGGTLPYLAGRLDGAVRSYAKGLDRLPGEYLRRFYYDVTVYHAPAVRCAVEFAGADRCMFGTDHPFKKDPDDMLRSLERLSPADRRAVLGDTARTLFRI